MPSAIKTTNIGLNQWSGNEYPKRLDFVEDNAAIDAAIGKPANLTTIDKTNLVAAVNEVKEQTNNLVDNKADLVNGKVPSIQLPNIEVPVQSVNSKTGAVVLTKSDIGLGNVDNTADSAKAVLSAIKLATPRAINGVNFDGTAPITISDSTKAPTSHASSGAGYGVGTTSNYGHVKVRNDLLASAYADGEAVSSYQAKLLNDKILAMPTDLVNALEVSFLHKFLPLTHFLNDLVFGSAFYSLATVIRVDGVFGGTAFIRSITINIPNVPYVLISSYNDHTTSGSTGFMFYLRLRRTSDNADIFTTPTTSFRTYESGGTTSAIYFVPKIYRGTTQTINIYAEDNSSIMARTFDHSAFTISPAVVNNGLY